jgi:hypothetical protein
VRTSRRLSVLIFVLIESAGTWAQQSEGRIYSNLEYNEEGGDLLGVELQITSDAGQVKGQLKIYEGGCAAPMAVSGWLTGSRIQLSGKSDGYGKIELVGTIRDDAFSGVLRLEKGEKPEKVRLKRISKPHC